MHLEAILINLIQGALPNPSTLGKLRLDYDGWSVDRGTIDANPIEKGGRLYKGERSENVWTDADEAAFLAKAPKHSTCRP